MHGLVFICYWAYKVIIIANWYKNGYSIIDAENFLATVYG